MDTATRGPRSAALVAALARTLGAEVIETHISWVLLAGDLALKIKKPLRLPFVDYGTLRARRHFCEEELRLNSRLAPSIYLAVARITGSCAAPRVDGPGRTLEVAVRMRRFAPGSLFGERLTQGTLTPAEVDQLASLLAGFHTGSAPRVPPGPFASASQRRTVACAAFEGARAAASAVEQERLRNWLDTQSQALSALWTARCTGGRVRECHGDLHLDNVVCLEGRVAAFDCIEFDAALRCIDVIDDIAFPVMDFSARGRSDFAFRLLNGWLDLTGDHMALPALRFSAVYRALVRAQVELLRGAGHQAAARRYFDTALGWARPGQGHLYITHGLPGSGKTWRSQRLLERAGAIRLRSDVERKRLFGLAMLANSRERGIDLYAVEATARTYEHLFTTARTLLQARYPVILDAAFLRRGERVQARRLASELDVPYSIIDCEAPLDVLRERLSSRRHDASEADVSVMERLRLVAEPLSDEELSFVLGEPLS
jgi:uncharacterized protein